jgi:hypothetical protein
MTIKILERRSERREEVSVDYHYGYDGLDSYVDQEAATIHAIRVAPEEAGLTWERVWEEKRFANPEVGEWYVEMEEEEWEALQARLATLPDVAAMLEKLVAYHADLERWERNEGGGPEVTPEWVERPESLISMSCTGSDEGIWIYWEEVDDQYITVKPRPWLD